MRGRLHATGACRVGKGVQVEKLAKIIALEDSNATLSLGTMVWAPQQDDMPVHNERWRCPGPKQGRGGLPVLCKRFEDSEEKFTSVLSAVNAFTQQEQSSVQIDMDALRVSDVLLWDTGAMERRTP